MSDCQVDVYDLPNVMSVSGGSWQLKKAADVKTGYVNEVRVVNIMYIVWWHFWHHNPLHSYFQVEEMWEHKRGLKNGCTAKAKECNSQWLNFQLKASNKWSATVVWYCSMSSSMIWTMRPGAFTLQQIQDDAQGGKVIYIPSDKALT